MPSQISIHRTVSQLICASAVILLVAACGKKDAASTQVVASVDGQELSVHQINSVLSKARGVTPENLPLVKAEILGGLVEQQLAINMAVDKKLDRTPDVVAAIENTKREILARAALEQITSTLPKPTDEEAKSYYEKNPALFRERRVFNLQEISFSKATPGIEEIRARAATAGTIEAMAAWLKEKNVNFSLNSGVRPAEQLPLEVLPKLHAFKDGQMGFVESEGAYLIMRVAASRAQPVTEAQAIPTIKLFLSNQRGAEAIKLAKADMKAKAKIEYFGEFKGGEVALKAKAEEEAKAAAEAKAAEAAKAQSSAEALAKQKLEEQAAAQAEQDARAKERADARAQAGKDNASGANAEAVNLEKGIKGLK
jgi:EpsD family peptidyl-prolyl cis-trans isomerase